MTNKTEEIIGEIKRKIFFGIFIIASIVEDTILVAAIIIGLWALRNIANFLGMQTEYPVMILITISEIVSITLYMILVIIVVLSFIKYIWSNRQ